MDYRPIRGLPQYACGCAEVAVPRDGRSAALVTRSRDSDGWVIGWKMTSGLAEAIDRASACKRFRQTLQWLAKFPVRTQKFPVRLT